MGVLTDAVRSVADSDHSLTERWEKVEGWPYWVSSEGRVYSEHTDMMLKQYTNETDTYLVVDLRKDGDRKQRTVHTLVAEYFVGDLSGKDVHHKDGDPTNNAASNLELLEREEHNQPENRGTGPLAEEAPF